MWAYYPGVASVSGRGYTNSNIEIYFNIQNTIIINMCCISYAKFI